MTATNQVPPSGGEPFNHDGFWKAIYVDPNGELQSMSVLAIVAEIVEGPPHFFVWAYDTVVDCESLPGYERARLLFLRGAQWDFQRRTSFLGRQPALGERADSGQSLVPDARRPRPGLTALRRRR